MIMKLMNDSYHSERGREDRQPACAPRGYPIRGSSRSAEYNSARRTDCKCVFHVGVA
jgi:hypothetical protein